MIFILFLVFFETAYPLIINDTFDGKDIILNGGSYYVFGLVQPKSIRITDGSKVSFILPDGRFVLDGGGLLHLDNTSFNFVKKKDLNMTDNNFLIEKSKEKNVYLLKKKHNQNFTKICKNKNYFQNILLNQVKKNIYFLNLKFNFIL